MWALPTQPQKGDSLTRRLRKYLADNVKISKENKKHAKKLIKDYVEDQIIYHCERNSPLPLLRLEYTGSMYEGLKSVAAGEVDLMLIVGTTSLDVAVEDSGIPGYFKLRADVNSPFRKYADSWGYLYPARVREAWLYSLVSKAVNAFEMHLPGSLFRLRVSSHGPAVQIDIVRHGNGTGEKLLSADLVPCLQIGSDYHGPAVQLGMYLKLCPINPLLSVDLVSYFHIMDGYYIPKRYHSWKMFQIVISCESSLFLCRARKNRAYSTWTGKTMAEATNFYGSSKPSLKMIVSFVLRAHSM